MRTGTGAGDRLNPITLAFTDKDDTMGEVQKKKKKKEKAICHNTGWVLHGDLMSHQPRMLELVLLHNSIP